MCILKPYFQHLLTGLEQQWALLVLNVERSVILSISVSPSTQCTFKEEIMFYCFGWIFRCKTTGNGNTGVATMFGFANGCPGAAEEEWWIITNMNISNVYFTKRKTLTLGMQLSASGMYKFPQNLVQPPQNSGLQKGDMKQFPYLVPKNIRCHQKNIRCHQKNIRCHQKKKLVDTVTLRRIICAPLVYTHCLSDNHIDKKTAFM